MNSLRFFNILSLNATRNSRRSLQCIVSPIMHHRRHCADNIVDRPDDPKIVIPKPKPRPGESIQTRRARLLYQSRKRGMLENDILLSTFAAIYLAKFNASQIAEYDNLINGPSNDWDIYNWAINFKPTPDEYNGEVMTLLKEHCRNIKREPRLRQPDLN